MISLRDSQSRLQSELTSSGLSMRDWYRTIYLKSEHWQDLRKQAFETHGRVCRGCQKTARLDVHHLRYGFIFDVEVCDLQILCRECHDKEHAPNPVLHRKTRKRCKIARQKPKKKEKRTPLTKKQQKRLKQKLLNEKKAYGKHMDSFQSFSWKRNGSGFR